MEMLAAVVLVVVLALAALGAFVVPRGSRAAEAVKPTGRTAATTTPASMPRIAFFRRNLVMSGDLSLWFNS
jgi:hypothetical protein